jgi:excisionase family DNA binding protein
MERLVVFAAMNRQRVGPEGIAVHRRAQSLALAHLSTGRQQALAATLANSLRGQASMCYSVPRHASSEACLVEGQEWFTVDEAAAYLRVSRRTVYKLVEEGRLQAYVIGHERHRRFRRGDLDCVPRATTPDVAAGPTAPGPDKQQSDS